MPHPSARHRADRLDLFTWLILGDQRERERERETDNLNKKMKCDCFLFIPPHRHVSVEVFERHRCDADPALFLAWSRESDLIRDRLSEWPTLSDRRGENPVRSSVTLASPGRDRVHCLPYYRWYHMVSTRRDALYTRSWLSESEEEEEEEDWSNRMTNKREREKVLGKQQLVPRRGEKNKMSLCAHVEVFVLRLIEEKRVEQALREFVQCNWEEEEERTICLISISNYFFCLPSKRARIAILPSIRTHSRAIQGGAQR